MNTDDLAQMFQRWRAMDKDLTERFHRWFPWRIEIDVRIVDAARLTAIITAGVASTCALVAIHLHQLTK